MTTVDFLWWIPGALLVGAGEWMRQKARRKALLEVLMHFEYILSRWKEAMQHTDRSLEELAVHLRSSKELE